MKRTLSAIASCLGSILLAYGQIVTEVSVKPGSFKIETSQDGISTIIYTGTTSVESREGYPALPIVERRFYLASDKEDITLAVEVVSDQQLEGKYCIDIAKIQKAQAGEGGEEVGELSSGYDSEVAARVISDIKVFDCRIVTIAMYPFAYSQQNQTLRVRDVKVRIDNEGTMDMSEMLPNTTLQRRMLCEQYVQSAVDNPDDVKGLFQRKDTQPNHLAAAPQRRVNERFTVRLSPDEPVIPDFIIITNEALKPSFDRLAEWKTKRGIYTIVETTEYITSHYDGVDLCEQIRNYIAEKEQNWGYALSFLLGGGINVIPSREYNGKEHVEVTDIYYVDREPHQPNGTNTFYSISINSLIGRFPVDNRAEADLLIDKVISYENTLNIDYSYLDNHLYVDAYLDEAGIGPGAMQLIRQYAADGNYLQKNSLFLFDSYGQATSISGHSPYIWKGRPLRKEIFLNALANGDEDMGYFHFLYHLDHSLPTAMGTSQNKSHESVTNSDINDLDFPANYYQIVLSSGCHTADFTTDCIAKRFLMKQNSGAVAFIGNTDVGWSAEHKHLDKFLNIVFNKNTQWANSARLGLAWLDVVGFSSPGETKCRAHLFGDPTMTPWRKTPRMQNNSIDTHGSFITLQRAASERGKSATLCVYKEGEVFWTDTIKDRMSMQFYLSEPVSPGYVYVTSTGLDLKPYVDSVYVSGNTGGLKLLSYSLQDAVTGNGDGQLSSGETIEIPIVIENTTSADLGNQQLRISCNNPWVSIVQPTSLFSVRPQSTATVTGLKIKTSSNAPILSTHEANAIRLNVGWSNGTENQTLGYVSIDNLQPRVRCGEVEYDLEDDEGDYVYLIAASIVNNGESCVTGGTATLRGRDASGITIVDSIDHFSNLSGYEDEDMVGFYVSMPQPYNHYINASFDVMVRDGDGNDASFTIAPFSQPSALSLTEVQLTPYDGYIDIEIQGDSLCNQWKVYCSMNGNNYTCITPAPSNRPLIRHQNLQYQTKYYYKVSRVENGRESSLSAAKSCTTLCHQITPYAMQTEGAGIFYGFTTSWDVDLDGEKEIFATRKNWLENEGSITAIRADGSDYLQDTNAYLIGEYCRTEGNCFAGPAVGELFDDGDPYVVSTTYESTTNNEIRCMSTNYFDEDGEPIERWRVTDAATPFAARPAVIADIDGDDMNEIVVVATNGRVMTYSGDGTLLNSSTHAVSYRSAAVASVVPNSSHKQIVAPNGASLSVIDENGNRIVPYCTNFTYGVSSPIICDIDNDGQQEVVACELKPNGFCYVYLVRFISGGTQKESLFTTSYHNKDFVDILLAAGDMNGDHYPEIVANGLREVVIYDYYNQVETSVTKGYHGTGSRQIAPIIADVDGDGMPDAIYDEHYSEDYARIKALDYYGNVVEGFPLEMFNISNEGAHAADINGDGKTEIVLATESGAMQIWKTKGDSNHIEWGYPRGNVQNTGVYGEVRYPMLVSNANYSGTSTFHDDVYVIGNGVSVSGTVNMDEHRKMIVWNNGKVTINNGNVNNAQIIVKDGGDVTINQSIVNLRDSKRFVVNKGGRFTLSSGSIE